MSKLILLCLFYTQFVVSVFYGSCASASQNLDNDYNHSSCKFPSLLSHLNPSIITTVTLSPPLAQHQSTGTIQLYPLATSTPSILFENGNTTQPGVSGVPPQSTYTSALPINTSSNHTTLSTEDSDDGHPSALVTTAAHGAVVAEEQIDPKFDLPGILQPKDDILSGLSILDLARDIQVLSPDIEVREPPLSGPASSRDGVNLKRAWGAAFMPEAVTFYDYGYEDIPAPFLSAVDQVHDYEERSEDRRSKSPLLSFTPAMLWLLVHEDGRKRKMRRVDPPEQAPSDHESAADSNPPPRPAKPSNADLNGESTSITLICPDPKGLTPEILIAETKSIYAGLVIVEAKCIEVDQKQAALAQVSGSGPTKLTTEQWHLLTALHRTLLHEHFDFFLATQHPVASPKLKKLASKYAMPARMWRHGVHSYLELLRHRLPDSLEHMLTFIYIAYIIIAMLYENFSAFEDIWIECLGDLGRYRMAINTDDLRDREVWTRIATYWYSKISSRTPGTGRIHHHLAILNRHQSLNCLFLYMKSLSAVTPFHSSRLSIETLFEQDFSRIRPTEAGPFVGTYIRIHEHLLAKRPTEFEELLSAFVTVLDTHIGISSHHFIRQGSQLAISNCAALLGFGLKESPLARELSPSNSDCREPSKISEDAIELSDPALFSDSRQLFLRTAQVVLRRVGDTNIRSFTHIILVFILHLSSCPGAMALIEEFVPWEDLVVVLNSFIRCSENLDRIEGETFPGLLQVPQPLPEDFDLRGLVWSQNYLPEDWFANSHFDDEPVYMMESPTSQEDRLERILWLACHLASSRQWICYDCFNNEFSLPTTFYSEEDSPDWTALRIDSQISSPIASSLAISRGTQEDISDSIDECSPSSETRCSPESSVLQTEPSGQDERYGSPMVGSQISVSTPPTKPGQDAARCNSEVDIDYGQDLFEELPFSEFFDFGALLQGSNETPERLWEENAAMKITSSTNPSRTEAGVAIPGSIQRATTTNDPDLSNEFVQIYPEESLDPRLLDRFNPSAIVLPMQNTSVLQTGHDSGSRSIGKQDGILVGTEDQIQKENDTGGSCSPSKENEISMSSSSPSASPSGEQAPPASPTKSPQHTCPHCPNTYDRRCDLNSKLHIIITEGNWGVLGWNFRSSVAGLHGLGSARAANWECYGLAASEVFAEEFPKHLAIKSKNPDILWKLENAKQKWFPFDAWEKIVGSYTGGSLTYDSDKLIAISGIAKAIQTSLREGSVDSDYLVGLWKDAIHFQLLSSVKLIRLLACPPTAEHLLGRGTHLTRESPSIMLNLQTQSVMLRSSARTHCQLI
ncbi:uncharacterized protein PAC_00254 [Phialocephala subalpina]|uniref:Uncharacterized protein n=1 Tax=Phialocephala subalpina TaxID=576137 RepID=A0A1L7WC87_9HELO|nr:uncharacterized protein PAC_00254 [Phialocephala subalpina]